MVVEGVPIKKTSNWFEFEEKDKEKPRREITHQNSNCFEKRRYEGWVNCTLANKN